MKAIHVQIMMVISEASRPNSITFLVIFYFFHESGILRQFLATFLAILQIYIPVLMKECHEESHPCANHDGDF